MMKEEDERWKYFHSYECEQLVTLLILLWASHQALWYRFLLPSQIEFENGEGLLCSYQYDSGLLLGWREISCDAMWRESFGVVHRPLGDGSDWLIEPTNRAFVSIFFNMYLVFSPYMYSKCGTVPRVKWGWCYADVCVMCWGTWVSVLSTSCVSAAECESGHCGHPLKISMIVYCKEVAQ